MARWREIEVKTSGEEGRTEVWISPGSRFPQDRGSTLFSKGYDAAGNMTSWAGNAYMWDALGSMTQFNNGAWTYLYDANDRRVAILKDLDGTEANKEETYLIRDLSGKTLREFKLTGENIAGEERFQPFL